MMTHSDSRHLDLFYYLVHFHTLVVPTIAIIFSLLNEIIEGTLALPAQF